MTPPAASGAAPRAADPALPPIEVPTPERAPDLASIAEASFSDAWPASVFRAELERARTLALASLDPRGAVIGYALGWKVLDECELLSFAVRPGWRRRGVGSGLLRAYFARLLDRGVHSLRLEVRESNRSAQRLYRGLGMAHCGERRHYYRDGETALLFEVDLRARGG